MKKLLLLSLLAIFAMASCRQKESVASGGIQLGFSSDTVYLDTVITTVGSSTYTLKVRNPSSDIVEIDNISLGRGTSSKYRINVNGNSGNQHQKVEILPKDSIYIFIDVKASVIGSSQSHLYVDSLIFRNKGVEQNVKLVTLAQDVYFHFPTHFIVVSGTIIPYSIITNTTHTLPNDKPHVFYGYGVVDEGGELNINGGTDLYFHQNSGLWVFEGATLKVAEGATGGIGDSVTFTGDRLEPFYENAPGQWGGALGGIFIQGGSTDNVINNAVIKNATTALRVDSSSVPNLTITNSHILNSSRTGIYGGFGNMEAYNTVVANAGLQLFYAFGGNYQFRHCTFANYWNQSTRSTAAVTISNYLDVNDTAGNPLRLVRNLESCYFGNCIITGNNSIEFAVLDDEAGSLNYQMTNALLKTSTDPDEIDYDLSDQSIFTDIRINSQADFVNYTNNIYALDSNSQAVDQGNVIDGSMTNGVDILGNFRSFNGTPDLGAHERQY